MGNKDGKEAAPTGRAQPGQITKAVPGALQKTPSTSTPTANTKTDPPKPDAPKSPRPTSQPPASKPSPPKAAVLEDFEVLKVIGRGSFGTVYLVKKIDDGKIYAMKKLNKADIAQRGEIQHTLAEKAVMASVDSPFIAKLHFSFQNATSLYFVMDFINGGELFQHLCRESVFDEKRTKFYAASLILALETLHNAGIIYRDLKPENVLLKADGNIVLVDFGQAKAGLDGEGARTSTICGTPAYFAPELLQGEAYTKAVDWWSLGTMIYEMLWGVGPFWCEEESNMFVNIMEAELILGEDWSPEVNDLLTQLIERDPAKRLKDANEMKKHKWFSDIDWKKLQTLTLKPPFKPDVSSLDDVSQINQDIIKEPASLDDVVDAQEQPAPADAFAGFTYVQTD